MPSAGFEPGMQGIKRPKTYTTDTGMHPYVSGKKCFKQNVNRKQIFSDHGTIITANRRVIFKIYQMPNDTAVSPTKAHLFTVCVPP
jgi:hypothetical protein